MYYSKLILNNSELILLDYGDKNLFPVTKELFLENIFKTARYSPINILNYFVHHKIPISSKSDKEYAIYKTIINNSIVKLYISKKDNLLKKITKLSDNELFGDIFTSIVYYSFVQIGKFYFPKKNTNR